MLFNKNKKKDERKFIDRSNGFDDGDWDVDRREVRTIVKVKTRNSNSSKFEGIKRNSNKVFTIFLIIAVVLLIGFFGFIQYRKATVGVRAVMDMYNFNSISQLAEQQNDLQRICTPAVFDFNTVENVKVALNRYLGMQGKPVKVNIISKGDGYVLFSLVSPYVYADKRFIMLYKVNWLGKIDWMRQEVGVDAYNYKGTPWN